MLNALTADKSMPFAENRSKVASKRVQSDACIDFAERKQARRKLRQLLLKIGPIGVLKFGSAREKPYLCSVIRITSEVAKDHE